MKRIERMYQTLQTTGVTTPGRPHQAIIDVSSAETAWRREKRMADVLNAVVYKMDEIIDRLNALEVKRELE